MLNRDLAHALDAVAMLRAIRAAFTADPDPLLVDAEGDTGEDAAERVARRQLQAMADDAVRRWTGQLGG